MVNCERLLILVVSFFHVCIGASLENVRIRTQGRVEAEKVKASQESLIKRTWNPSNNPGTLNVPTQYYGLENVHSSPYSSSHRNTKKSDLPEKGQIKFMKTLLGKVKTLLKDSQSKKKSSTERKSVKEGQEKISSLTADNGKVYGVLGDSGNTKDKEGEKSVNVISIPLNALTKISKSEPGNEYGDSSSESRLDTLESRHRNAEVLLRPLPVRTESDEDREEIPLSENRLVPLIVQNPGQGEEVAPIMIVNPQTRTLQPLSDFTGGEMGSTLESPKMPLLLQRHGDIVKHSRGDDSLYRDIGHIPGESRFHAHGLDENIGKTILRHKSPMRYHHPHAPRPYAEDDEDDRRYNNNDEDDDDDDDDGDDEEDEDEDDADEVPDFRTRARMNAEEQEIAATRKRLFAMLPGNDPTYTSENRGLGLMRPSVPMQLPEAFLGNPMLRGMGFNQRNVLPFSGEALAGEHADNANGRAVFMLGNQGTRQVLGDYSSNMMSNPMGISSVRVNPGGFILGGSQAQAMSPNEVSYLIQRPTFSNQLSQKDKITRPKDGHVSGNVLLEVNGRPIVDSTELRDHIVNGRILKGKGKLIKSKGPVDVKISRGHDGVHSKVVDITSSTAVNVLNAKSKIAKTH